MQQLNPSEISDIIRQRIDQLDVSSEARNEGTIVSVTDGIIRIRRETKGRKGKGVTTVSGFDLDTEKLKALAKQLKKTCSTGGTVKDGIIEIQGDHRDSLKQQLDKMGYQVKQAGG